MRPGTRLRQLLFLGAVIAACGEPIDPALPTAPTSIVLPRHSLHFDPASQTVTVVPTGGDDTDNLQQAFDHCAAYQASDCTVQLLGGLYSVRRPIVVADFDGRFVGSGQHATVLVAGIDSAPWPTWTAPFPSGAAPIQLRSVFVFHQTDRLEAKIEVSDLSVRYAGPAATALEQVHLVFVLGRVTFKDGPEQSSVSTTFERVRFEGGPSTSLNPQVFTNTRGAVAVVGEPVFGGRRVAAGIFGFLTTFAPKYTKPITGLHRVADCSFERMRQPLFFSGLLDSRITVGGDDTAGNYLSDVRTAVDVRDMSNSTIEVSHNELRGVRNFGVLISQAIQSVGGIGSGPYGDLPQISEAVISHNRIHVVDIGDGVGLIDRSADVGATKRLAAVVSANYITLDDSWFGGIVGLRGARDVLVEHNRIRGTGLSGVYLGVVGPNSGWTVVGNNVQHVTAREGVSGFPIWLGSQSSNNTVVGGSNRSNVFDQGIGNIVTGVNNMQGNDPGQSLRDAMGHKLDEALSVTPW